MKYISFTFALIFFVFSRSVDSFSTGSFIKPALNTKQSQRLKASREKLDNVDETSDSINYKRDIQNTGAWFAASTAFCGLILQAKGIDSAVEFASGYFLEQALSLDNLFVFILLFGYFKVPKENETKVLNYGIIGGRVSFFLYHVQQLL
jgi:hypothetical protein